MIPLQSYVRQGRHVLRRWALDPRVHIAARVVLYILSGFCLSAASLGNVPLPLALGLVAACDRWQALLAASGACAGYLVFWGGEAYPCLAWLGLGLAVTAVLCNWQVTRRVPLLLPAVQPRLPTTSTRSSASLTADLSHCGIPGFCPGCFFAKR